MEIPLCGHATLASARVVFAAYAFEEAHFVTISGENLAAYTSQDQVSMVFPDHASRPAEAPEALLRALGLDAIENAVYNDETKILLVEITDIQVLADLTPDFAALYQSHRSINGVLVTAPSGEDGYDFHSRYFWPWSGTNEAPVTGGTHTFLAKYWSDKLGKLKLKSYQSSRRSGFMDVELEDGILIISSQAIIVLEGIMFV